MSRLLETPAAKAAAAPIRTPANLSQRILVVEDDTAKPFSPDRLLETVKEVLRAADRAGFGHEISLPARDVALSQTSPSQYRAINDEG